jgi:hypothetical protein
MTFNLTFYTIFTFLFSIFGKQSKSTTINSTILIKSVEIPDNFSSKNFNNVITAYQDFYGKSCSNLNINMGDICSIEQRIKLNSDNDILEIVYNERILREGNKLIMNVEIVDIFFYNKRRTRFKKMKSEDIRRNSKRGNILLQYKEDIKVKCDKLLIHLAS